MMNFGFYSITWFCLLSILHIFGSSDEHGAVSATTITLPENGFVLFHIFLKPSFQFRISFYSLISGTRIALCRADSRPDVVSSSSWNSGPWDVPLHRIFYILQGAIFVLNIHKDTLLSQTYTHKALVELVVLVLAKFIALSPEAPKKRSGLR
jgi:hypothetical protein